MYWRLGYIILGTIIIYWLVDLFGKRLWIAVLSNRTPILSRRAVVTRDYEQRIETLSSVFTKTEKVILVLIALVMILDVLDLNIAPLLTSAGIVGIIFGFGAQSLVKDIVAGIFVIVEHQYVKGDKIALGEVTGTVIHLSLRTTVLRDEAGVEHYIPNGSVIHVANFSKNKAKA